MVTQLVKSVFPKICRGSSYLNRLANNLQNQARFSSLQFVSERQSAYSRLKSTGRNLVRIQENLLPRDASPYNFTAQAEAVEEIKK